MEEIYLTPNLYTKNKKTYYFDDNTKKIKKVNNNNWHHYYSEAGWEKIDNGWIRRLNKYKKNKNSPFGIKDCGGNGDCLFHVVAEAICEPDMEVIREMAANEITDENYSEIMESYRIEYDLGEHLGQWNPYNIKNKEELKNEIIKTGNNFWGDHNIILLLEKALDINFIILNSEKLGKNLKEKFNIYSLGHNYKEDRKSIILYYMDNEHFRLVGYFDETYMCVLFDKLPEELLAVYREDCCQTQTI